MKFKNIAETLWFFILIAGSIALSFSAFSLIWILLSSTTDGVLWLLLETNIWWDIFGVFSFLFFLFILFGVLRLIWEWRK